MIPRRWLVAGACAVALGFLVQPAATTYGSLFFRGPAAEGPPGPAGPQGRAPSFTFVEKAVLFPPGSPVGTTEDVGVACPDSAQMHGGAAHVDGPPDQVLVVLTGSFPSDARTWNATAVVIVALDLLALPALRVTAFCA